MPLNRAGVVLKNLKSNKRYRITNKKPKKIKVNDADNQATATDLPRSG